MKSKASCFSISGPLFVENIRRYWAIMAVAFIAYFLTSLSPIMLSLSEPDLRESAGYINDMLHGQNPLFVSMGFAMPIICAVTVLAYMQRQAAATSMHAMPFSRAKLFNTSVLSGFVMTIVPFIITGIILLALARPTYLPYYYDDMGILEEGAENVFARVAVLRWMAESIVSMLFIYAIAIFGGIISGNSIMHAIMAVCWNWLAPSLALVGVYLSSEYLYGYGTDMEWIMNLSTVLRTIMSDPLSGAEYITYILIAIAIIVLSAFLYSRRKLERTGEAIVFAWMKPILCCLFTLFVTILMGLYFEALQVIGNSDVSVYAGYAVGAVVGYLISRMIVFKTPKVFNTATLKGFIIYVIILAAIFAGFIFDIGGYETRVPKESSIEAVYISIPEMGTLSTYERFNMEHFVKADEDSSIYYKYGYANLVRFETSESVNEVLSINKYLAENNEFSPGKTMFESLPEDYEEAVYNNINIIYDLGDKTFERHYYVRTDALKDNEDFQNLIEGSEFKDVFSFENLNMKGIDEITVTNSMARETATFTGDAATELLAAMDADFKARSYDEEINDKNMAFVEFKIIYDSVEPETDSEGVTYPVSGYVYMNLHLTDENTIAWLETHGFNNITTMPAYVARSAELYYLGNTVYAVNDKELIEYALENGLRSTNSIPYNRYFTFTFYSSPDAAQKHLDLVMDYNRNTDEVDWEIFNETEMQIQETLLVEVYVPVSEMPQDLLHEIMKSDTFAEWGYNQESLGI